MTTAHISHIDGFTVTEPNETTDGNGFYISYNNYDTRIYGSDTTALVLGQMQHFYILNGDHRAAYAELIPQGFDACLEYFKAHAGEMNKYSEQGQGLAEFAIIAAAIAAALYFAGTIAQTFALHIP